MAKNDDREVDETSPLWKDIVDLLETITPIRPKPSVDTDTALGGGKNGLRLSPLIREGLSRNWNGMIDTYKTGRTKISRSEAGDLETAGDVWLRIASQS